MTRKTRSQIRLLGFLALVYVPILLVTLVAAQVNNDATTAPSCQSLTLTLEEATVTLPGTSYGDVRITTRLFDGTYPGPTLLWYPGDCWHVTFFNALSTSQSNGIPFRNNILSAPDETNLHFHGLHISGELPSDDTSLVIPPGGNYTYTIQVPDYHMPGTHWYHPHRHGSSALQVGGGAVAALIIADPPGYLPAALENAPEIVFLVHALDVPELRHMAREMQDNLLRVENHNGVTITVNGQILPEFRITAGTWTRIRILWADWRKGTLDWDLQSSDSNGDCQVYLLAKDGMYIRDFPRRMVAPMPLLAGSRADVMVQCLAPGQIHTITGPNGTAIARLNVVGEAEVKSLPTWAPDWPDYLPDLTEAQTSPGCSAVTRLDGHAINGKLYDHSVILHHSYRGAVIERRLCLDDHPYHQHVYPFQIIQGFGASESENAFYRVGDWQDVVQGRGVMRYQANDFAGKLMLHCHQLEHEDEGMMAVEMIHETISEFEALYPPSSSHPTLATIPTARNGSQLRGFYFVLIYSLFW